MAGLGTRDLEAMIEKYKAMTGLMKRDMEQRTQPPAEVTSLMMHVHGKLTEAILLMIGDLKRRFEADEAERAKLTKVRGWKP